MTIRKKQSGYYRENDWKPPRDRVIPAQEPRYYNPWPDHHRASAPASNSQPAPKVNQQPVPGRRPGKYKPSTPLPPTPKPPVPCGCGPLPIYGPCPPNRPPYQDNTTNADWKKIEEFLSKIKAPWGLTREVLDTRSEEKK